ncbi:DEAD/DEAH box helicase family protein [Candidatus Micrarchaeota archaeon]|nr:DEAD/DEAH box helicase family protein [Candidatus Micrarchaeota archaeon]
MNIKPRAYQQNIYQSIISKGNSLVVLPTGLGKTLIALMLINDKYMDGKCLLLTPTKPLAQQHYNSVLTVLGLSPEHVTIVTGDLSPSKRTKEYDKNVIIATPQTVRNDLNNGLLTSSQIKLAIFDEAHKAVGDYAYTRIADVLPEDCLLLGLTASPGGKRARIEEVLKNLKLSNVEIRTSKDKDVQDYLHKIDIKWIFVSLPPSYRMIKIYLDELIKKHAKTLGSMGFPPPLRSKTQFMALRARIMNSKSRLKFPAIIQYSILLNLLHMVELLETQSMQSFSNYLSKMENKDTKSAKILLNKPEIIKIKQMCRKNEDHPKMVSLLSLSAGLKEKKAIIFAQYRDQVMHISEKLSGAGFNARPFMGRKDNYNRKMQEETIRDFRGNKFQFLVASSVGEEGLDIPAVDAVIFYEPIPSEIRSIQRRGRTGRFGYGEVYMLITKKSRDEYFYHASLSRERKMKTILKSYTSSKSAVRKLYGQTKVKDWF